MKYKPTILNTASALLILTDNYKYWTDYAKGEIYEYGGVALVLSMLVAVAGLLADLALQRYIRNRWVVNGIGLLLVLLFIWFYTS